VPIEHNPVIEITKDADVTSAKVGDTIHYTIVVKHAPGSDGTNISNVVVSDVFGITPTYVGGDDGDGILEAGEVWTYTVDYTVQAGDTNPLINIAIVTGEDEDGDEVTDDDEESIPIEEKVNPRLCVDKTGPAYAYVGDTINYTFYVYNTGDVPLSDITVFDSVTGEATYKSGDVNNNGLLDVDEVWVFTDTWVVQESPDPLRNTAIATGYFGDVSYTAEDDHCVDVYKVVDESAEEVVDNNDAVGSDDNSGASTNDPQDATTMTGTGSGASFPWVLLIVGMIGAAVTIAAMAVYRRRSP